MSGISTYLENALLDATLRNTSYTPPTTVYLALFTSSTGLEAGTLTNELSGGAYARQAITFGTPNDGVVSNSSAIAFAQATANWAGINATAIMDAATGGNVLYWAACDLKNIDSGETMVVGVGKIKVQLQ